MAGRLMEEAATMMALVLDCFDHTPWTSAGQGKVPALSSAEVLHNWAQSKRSGRWTWQVLHRGTSGFARPMCQARLGAACVDTETAEITISGLDSKGSGYLLQCAALKHADGQLGRNMLQDTDGRGFFMPQPQMEKLPNGRSLGKSPAIDRHILLPALAVLGRPATHVLQLEPERDLIIDGPSPSLGGVHTRYDLERAMADDDDEVPQGVIAPLPTKPRLAGRSKAG
ncbi:unnamed protein product [Effrenium voratum]|uniref:Uncharacterized protein n=1 Tax=Effrenium voratum TaxID=2562239 RepID=A0AA36ND23_9DINO|nr:unnamed protein product [Effrenium voratum]